MTLVFTESAAATVAVPPKSKVFTLPNGLLVAMGYVVVAFIGLEQQWIQVSSPTDIQGALVAYDNTSFGGMQDQDVTIAVITAYLKANGNPNPSVTAANATAFYADASLVQQLNYFAPYKNSFFIPIETANLASLTAALGTIQTAVQLLTIGGDYTVYTQTGAMFIGVYTPPTA